MLKIRKSEWEVLKQNLINSGIAPFDSDRIISDHQKLHDNFKDKLKLKVEEGELSTERAETLFKQKFYEMWQKLA